MLSSAEQLTADSERSGPGTCSDGHGGVLSSAEQLTAERSGPGTCSDGHGGV